MHAQGYFYVEAYKEDHVKEAIRGLRSIFISKGAALVPLNEMVEALTVSSKASAASLGDNFREIECRATVLHCSDWLTWQDLTLLLSGKKTGIYERSIAGADIGAWVRVKAGDYRGDLAKVMDVDVPAQRATIQLIPRLDYAAMAQRREEGGRALPFGRKAGGVKPPSRFVQKYTISATASGRWP